MAEIIQYYHKDDDIQFDIIIRARSVKCHSAMIDMPEIDKQTIRYVLADVAKEYIAQYLSYAKK